MVLLVWTMVLENRLAFGDFEVGGVVWVTRHCIDE